MAITYSNPKKLYRPIDSALRILGKEQTLARWRHEGYGLDYFKIGARILSSGSALNEWLESCKITPKGP